MMCDLTIAYKHYLWGSNPSVIVLHQTSDKSFLLTPKVHCFLYIVKYTVIVITNQQNNVSIISVAKH